MSAPCLLLLGGGGHCHSVLDCIDFTAYSRVGIVDAAYPVGSKRWDIPVLGSDDDLTDLFGQGYTHGFVTVAFVGNSAVRIKLHDLLRKTGFILPNIISPCAVISSRACLEAGVFVGKRAVINAGAKVGEGAVVNTGAVVEHDCVIEPYAQLAPGTVLGGEVTVGRGAFVGMGSLVKQGCRIGAGAMIGMGSNVLKDIASDMLAYGAPCVEVRHV